ncbi:hypothetical protein D3C84_802780 [compost metagenome]
MLSVIDGPLTHFAFPDARSKLTARAGIVVVDRLLRVAFEDFLGCRTITFGFGDYLGEVDDLVNAHGGFSCLFNKMNISRRLVRLCQIY